MKNQNDLIAMIVAIVICVGGGLSYFFFGKRTVTKPADPAPVPVTAAKPKEGAVTMANGLPGSGSGAGRAGGGGGPSFAGTPGGPGGPGGPAPGVPGKMRR